MDEQARDRDERPYTLMASADRCSVFPQHHMVNTGRDEALYGDVFECACGLRRLGNTDEHKARYGVPAVGGPKEAPDAE